MEASLGDIPEISYSQYQADPAERRLVVRFSTQAKLDRVATEADKDGREHYKDVDYITILVPGDKTSAIHRPVQPTDKVRFSEAYRAFKAQKGQTLIGTPLAGWPMITEAQRKELEYFNVFTVEQLAGMADGYASAMMGVQQLKQAAIKFLQVKSEDASSVKVAKMLEERDNQIAVLKDQLEKLAEKVNGKGK